MRVFLDTNVLVDILTNRLAFVADSEAVIKRCIDLNAEMFVAWHGLATAYYLIRKGKTEADTLIQIDKIFSWAQIADVSDRAARKALHLGFSDFEDALQSVSAESCGADFIITRNISDFSRSSVSPMTPVEFLTAHPAPTT